MRYILAIILGLTAAFAPAEELIIFALQGCRPCAQFKQMLNDNPDLVRGFKVSVIDINADPQSAAVFNVGSVPTVVRLNDADQEIARFVGYRNRREFSEWLQHPSARYTTRRSAGSPTAIANTQESERN
jgi:thioredoxin-like negative regulator of GroEL